jgi:hypothetical protein
MQKMMRGLAAGAALALAALSGGCAGYGWDNVYDGGGWGGGSEVRGTVTSVHDRYNTIRVRRDNGRITDVRYDSRTQVVYRDRRTGPGSLDRGDYVSMRVNRDSRGQLYTRHVTVRREARAGYRGARDRARRDDRWDDRRDRRDDGWSNVRSLDGRVGRVDRSGRRFELRTENRGTVWVSLPYSADRSVRERFSRLRTGDYVHVSGRYAGNGRFQMDRFR